MTRWVWRCRLRSTWPLLTTIQMWFPSYWSKKVCICGLSWPKRPVYQFGVNVAAEVELSSYLKQALPSRRWKVSLIDTVLLMFIFACALHWNKRTHRRSVIMEPTRVLGRPCPHSPRGWWQNQTPSTQHANPTYVSWCGFRSSSALLHRKWGTLIFTG